MSVFLLSWYVIDCANHFGICRLIIDFSHCADVKTSEHSHRASVRLFMWHVYFWLSFSLFHWYSNCPLHHTSCLFKVSSLGVTQFTQFNRFSQFSQFTQFAQFTQFMFYFLFLVIYCCFPNNMLLLSSSIDVCPISPNVGWRVIRAPTDTFLVYLFVYLFVS